MKKKTVNLKIKNERDKNKLFMQKTALSTSKLEINETKRINIIYAKKKKKYVINLKIRNKRDINKLFMQNKTKL